jgi:hypothetical protein
MSQRLARLNAGSLLRKVRAICVGVAHPVANTAPEGAGPLCERRPAGLNDVHIDDSSSTFGLRATAAGAKHRRHVSWSQGCRHHSLALRDFTASGTGQPVHEDAQSPDNRTPHLRRAHHRLMCPALTDYSLVGPTQTSSRRPPTRQPDDRLSQTSFVAITRQESRPSAGSNHSRASSHLRLRAALARRPRLRLRWHFTDHQARPRFHPSETSSTP